MVIISASICTRAGKILLARQFAPLSKLTLEEYIKNFPKAISSTAQHTFIETESIRYVYLPLESLYLVLITTKHSNIVEDLETIRLLQKVVNDLCPHGLEEETIGKKAFDILLCFDDVIALGYRESVTLPQIQASLGMESSQEKLHQMLMKVRMNEAQEAMKKHALEADKKRHERNHDTTPSSYSNQNAMKSQDESPQRKMEDLKSFTSREEATTVVHETRPSSNPTNVAPKKGMALGKKKAPQEEVKVESTPKTVAAPSKNEELIREAEEETKHVVNPLKEPITAELIEKMNCSLTRDGVVNSFEVVGELMLEFHDPAKTNAAIVVDHDNLKSFNVKPHPALNRNLWNQSSTLAPKEAGEGFPCFSKFSTIKYRYASTEANDLPFTFTLWQNKQSLTLEIEFNSGQKRIPQITDLNCILNTSPNDNPKVTKCESSDYQMSGSKVVWQIPRLNDSTSNANIEISFGSGANLADLPIDIQFSMSSISYYRVGIKEAVNQADKAPLKVAFTRTLRTENFKII